MRKRWESEELEYLKKNYKRNNIEKMKLDLNRSEHAIRIKANEIGLKVKSTIDKRYWTEKEIYYLEKYYGKVNLEKLAKNLNRTKHSVYLKAIRTVGLIKEQGYTATELARAINVHTSTVASYAANGLKSKKLKRYRFIKTEDFWEFAKEHKKTIKFYRFEKNSIPNEPEWVDIERVKQAKKARKNQGKQWTNYEDIMLMNLVKRGKTSKEIAKELNRSCNSIQLRRSILNVKFIIDMERGKNEIQV